MQVEELGKLERRLSISLALADIEKEVDARLKRLSRTIKMAGFRPGKVPLKIVAKQYGFQVQSDVLNERVGSAFNKAIEEHHLRVAGSPNIAPRSGDKSPEGEVAFDATFEVYPEVKIGDLSAIEVEVPQTEAGEAEVEKTLEILRKQRVHYHARGETSEHGDGGVKKAVEGDDRVTVDFEGTIGGLPFEGGSASGFTFVLGEGRMLAEFEAAVRGMQPGESKLFDLTFPSDYHGKDVAGKAAQFKLTLRTVEWPHIPEVDAAFAQSLGIEDGDLAKMRADIHANLQREIKKRIFARTKDNVMDALLKAADLEIPKALVENESARLMETTRQDLRQRGMKVEDVPFPAELFKTQAERRVRLGLIVADLVKTRSLAAKPEQIKSHVEDLAKSYENPTEVVRWYYSERKRLAEIEALVLEENVVNYVIGQVKTKSTPVAFDDLMGSATA